MPQPGPKPKPPALKLLQGNPGHRPIPDAPKLPPKAPKQPRWSAIFSTEAEPTAEEEARMVARDAAAEWRAVVPVLDQRGLLATVDRAVLVDYCVCWARLLQCERRLAREGLAVKGQKDNLVKHPQTTVAAQYRAALRNYSARLGLSPTDRGRLALPEGDVAEEAGPFD